MTPHVGSKVYSVKQTQLHPHQVVFGASKTKNQNKLYKLSLVATAEPN